MEFYAGLASPSCFSNLNQVKHFPCVGGPHIWSRTRHAWIHLEKETLSKRYSITVRLNSESDLIQNTVDGNRLKHTHTHREQWYLQRPQIKQFPCKAHTRRLTLKNTFLSLMTTALHMITPARSPVADARTSIQHGSTSGWNWFKLYPT